MYAVCLRLQFFGVFCSFSSFQFFNDFFYLWMKCCYLKSSVIVESDVGISLRCNGAKFKYINNSFLIDSIYIHFNLKKYGYVLYFVMLEV